MSGCVAELLRKQPSFFGNLLLRLPRRAGPARRTLASGGRETRDLPRRVAETDAPVIETAMTHEVMACALKHRTRRGRAEHGTLGDGVATRPPRSAARRGLHPFTRSPGLGGPERGVP